MSCCAIRGRRGTITSRVMLDPEHARAAFLQRHAVRGLNAPEEARVWDLLEMQRSALLMFTSCGWFFSDLAGIETIQVHRYAARVIDLLNQLGLDPPQKEFLDLLAEAKSNRPQKGNGARSVRPSEITLGVALLINPCVKSNSGWPRATPTNVYAG